MTRPKTRFTLARISPQSADRVADEVSDFVRLSMIAAANFQLQIDFVAKTCSAEVISKDFQLKEQFGELIEIIPDGMDIYGPKLPVIE